MFKGPLAPWQLPNMAEDGANLDLFLTKTAQHGKLASDSTKVNGNPFMCHMTSTRYMGKHVLGPFCSLATPRNGKKTAQTWTFFGQKKVKHGRLATDFDSANRALCHIRLCLLRLIIILIRSNSTTEIYLLGCTVNHIALSTDHISAKF